MNPRRTDEPIIRRFRHESPPSSDPGTLAGYDAGHIEVGRVTTSTYSTATQSFEDDEPPEPAPALARISPRITGTDPTFGLLFAFALNIGLAPLVPELSDLRFVVATGVLAFFGVFAWLLGETERIGKERIDNLVWGIVFGVIIGLPILFVGGTTLQTTVELIFRTGGANETIVNLSPASVLALVVFVLPLGETLFFRGLMQFGRAFWLVGAVASVWSILLFFPLVEIGRYPVVAVLIGSTLILVNMIYSYVRQRNGVAAAWLCQITIGILVLFLPYVGV
jgi:hypothetical protein